MLITLSEFAATVGLTPVQVAQLSVYEGSRTLTQWAELTLDALDVTLPPGAGQSYAAPLLLDPPALPGGDAVTLDVYAAESGISGKLLADIRRRDLSAMSREQWSYLAAELASTEEAARQGTDGGIVAEILGSVLPDMSLAHFVRLQGLSGAQEAQLRAYAGDRPRPYAQWLAAASVALSTPGNPWAPKYRLPIGTLEDHKDFFNLLFNELYEKAGAAGASAGVALEAKTSVVSLLDEAGNVIGGMVTDVRTERQQAQAASLQAHTAAQATNESERLASAFADLAGSEAAASRLERTKAEVVGGQVRDYAVAVSEHLATAQAASSAAGQFAQAAEESALRAQVGLEGVTDAASAVAQNATRAQVAATAAETSALASQTSRLAADAAFEGAQSAAAASASRASDAQGYASAAEASAAASESSRLAAEASIGGTAGNAAASAAAALTSAQQAAASATTAGSAATVAETQRLAAEAAFAATDARAGAALDSAQSAGTSATAAGSAATAARADRLAAEAAFGGAQTAQGSAESAASAALTSSQSATAAASAASASAAVAEQQRLAVEAAIAGVEGGAGSSIESAQQAAASATAAGNSATAAQTARLAAEAAYGQADNRANAAIEHASQASASANAAGASAAASESSRLAAQTAAGQAEVYRNESASSNAAAQDARSVVQTSAATAQAAATAAQGSEASAAGSESRARAWMQASAAGQPFQASVRKRGADLSLGYATSRLSATRFRTDASPNPVTDQAHLLVALANTGQALTAVSARIRVASGAAPLDLTASLLGASGGSASLTPRLADGALLRDHLPRDQWTVVTWDFQHTAAVLSGGFVPGTTPVGSFRLTVLGLSGANTGEYEVEWMAVGALDAAPPANEALIQALADQFNAEIVLKVNAGGQIAGIGVRSEAGMGSDVDIVADRFSVSAPGSGPIKPFTVVGNEVKINGNLIATGTISASVITAGRIEAAPVGGGTGGGGGSGGTGGPSTGSYIDLDTGSIRIGDEGGNHLEFSGETGQLNLVGQVVGTTNLAPNTVSDVLAAQGSYVANATGVATVYSGNLPFNAPSAGVAMICVQLNLTNTRTAYLQGLAGQGSLAAEYRPSLAGVPVAGGGTSYQVTGSLTFTAEVSAGANMLVIGAQSSGSLPSGSWSVSGIVFKR